MVRPDHAPCLLAGARSPAVSAIPCRDVCGLEELYRVAGGVIEHCLRAAGTADDLVPEGDARCPKPRGLRVDVLDDEMDSIPAARLGLTAIGHGPPSGARFTTQMKHQVTAPNRAERRCVVGFDRKPEVCRVKGDARCHIVDHVADVDVVIQESSPLGVKSVVACGSRRARRVR